MKTKKDLLIEKITKKISRKEHEDRKKKPVFYFLCKHIDSFDELMGWKWSLNNLCCELIWDHVRNFAYWTKVSYQYSMFLKDYGYDWDFASLLMLLRFKLQRKYDFFSGPDTNIMDSESVAGEIKVVIDLIDKYFENNSDEPEISEHEKKWGELEFIRDSEDDAVYDVDGNLLGRRVFSDRANVKTEEDREQEEKERRKIRDLYYERKMEYWNGIWDGLKKAEGWWD